MSRAEHDRGDSAYLRVDLVSHVGVDAQPCAQPENFLGFCESAPGCLDADGVASTRKQFTRGVTRRGDAFVADDGNGGLLYKPPPPHRFLRVAGLFEEAEAQVLGAPKDLERLICRPAAVGVEIEVYVVPQPFAEYAAGLNIQGDGAPTNLELEGRYPLFAAEPLCFVKDHLGFRESEHVAHTHGRCKATNQTPDGVAGCLADDVP